MYVRYVLVQYAAVCYFGRLYVCVPGVLVLVKSGHRIFKNVFKCFKYSCELVFLTHCGRVTQICVFNTVKLGTSASSP